MIPGRSRGTRGAQLGWEEEFLERKLILLLLHGESTPFSVSGAGSMRAVAGFLWRLESSPLPVRLTELQLGARREGTDDLNLQVRLSALCQPPGPSEPSTPRAGPAGTTAPAAMEDFDDE